MTIQYRHHITAKTDKGDVIISINLPEGEGPKYVMKQIKMMIANDLQKEKRQLLKIITPLIEHHYTEMKDQIIYSGQRMDHDQSHSGGLIGYKVAKVVLSRKKIAKPQYKVTFKTPKITPATLIKRLV